MGQKQVNPYSQYEKEYTIISKNENDELLIRHKQTAKQYMLRKVIVKSQQELQQRIKLLNRRRKIKSEHLLNIVDFKPINDDRICGNSIYISLLIQYPFQSLLYQTLHRLSQPQAIHKASTNRPSPLYFQQHQLWSILYSCALGLEALYLSDMSHQGINKDIIFIDKEGVVKIGDPVLLGTRTNYDRVIDLLQQQKNKQENSNRPDFYPNDKNQAYLRKINKIKQINQQKTNIESDQNKISNLIFKSIQGEDSSIIVSPELISLCKDHQYYFFDKQKSDVYVLGALMIQLAFLDDVASVDIKNKNFKTDFTQIFAQNSKLKQRYSVAFISIIENMVDLDPKKRFSLNEIVGKIQEFSIQQNSFSEQSSIKKNSIEPQKMNNNIQPLFPKYLTGNQSNLLNFNLSGLPTDIKDFNLNTFKSNNIQPSFDASSYIPNISLNTYQYPNSVGPFHQFPSFSIPKEGINPSKPTLSGNYQESAVKSLFSKKLPVQIKYAESPLIVPVSNVRLRDDQKKVQNLNYSTPFHNLNLTQSNQKKIVGRDIQKESIVQNKFSLFGPNSLQGDHLFQKLSGNQIHKSNIQTQRFSLNNFGKIQINNGSLPTSVNTSMLPTPRFQNPFSTQFNLKFNQFSKPPITNSFQDIIAYNYVQNSTGVPLINNVNNNFPTFNGLNDNQYQNKFSNHNILGIKSVSASSYNPKKQGFSISDDFKDEVSIPTDKNTEPYFVNSSVGYTLPRYRPESTSSEIIQSNSPQKLKRSQSRQQVNVVSNGKNISPSKRIMKETQSFLQRANSPLRQKEQANPNSTSMINSITNLDNQKYETISNSSQNTVKKQTGNSKNSSNKKYNFYKKELNQKLQKIQQPLNSQLSNTKNILISQNQNIQSPVLKQNLNLSQSQNSVTQIHYEPQIHSIYVEEKQQNGSFYRGYKLNNKRHGNGVLIFADSGYYEGQFNHDQMEGYGKLYYNQRDLAYQGQFFQNYFHGHGILYNHSPEPLYGKFDFANLSNINNFWIKCNGYFKEDQKSGKCHIYFTNGEQFEGYCQNNTFQGNGRFKTLDGDYIDGVWKNNVLIQIKNDGRLSELDK